MPGPTKQTSEIAEGYRDSARPETIARTSASRCRSRSIADALEKEEKPITYVAQNNQYDIDFLLALARRAGYVIFVKEEERKDKRVIKPRRLYFGPSDAKQPG